MLEVLHLFAFIKSNKQYIVFVGPVGVAIGVLVGAIVGAACGIAVKYGYKKYLEKKHELQNKLVKEALKFFFNDENYDVEDKEKFNDKILRKTYRRLALIYHPERPDGDNEGWLKLSSYYGILTAIWDEMNEESDDDLNEEQELILINEAIRDRCKFLPKLKSNNL